MHPSTVGLGRLRLELESRIQRICLYGILAPNGKRLARKHPVCRLSHTSLLTFGNCNRFNLGGWDKLISGVEFLIVSWKLYEESEETYVPDQPSSHASGVATSLAAEIQNPETGDVIIETVHKDGTKVRYYVLRQVVCCYPYFKAGSVRSLSLVNAIADEWRTEC